MSENTITVHTDKMEIKNKNNEIIFYNDFIDTFYNIYHWKSRIWKFL